MTLQSLSTDKLRTIYSSSGLAIKPKARINKVEVLKEIIRAWSMNPKQVIAREALTQGATTNTAELENHQLTVLASQLKQLIRDETAGGTV